MASAVVATSISAASAQHAIESCRFLPAPSASGRALAASVGTRPAGGGVQVVAGHLTIDAASFTNSSALHGGALALSGPEASVVISRSVFTGNRAEMNGGAIHVSDGRLTLEAVNVTQNLAVHKGGGVYLSRGLIFLTQGSLIADNTVGEYRCDGGLCGASYYIEESVNGNSTQDTGIYYALPAPQASYVTHTADCRLESVRVYPHLCGPMFLQHPELHDAVVSRIDEPVYDEQYPYACAPGLYGRVDAVLDQRTAICSGRCPAGYYCPRGTTVPLECQPGTFCEEGSPRPTFCPGGSYSPIYRLGSPSGCHRVRAGFYAPRGSAHPKACPSDGFKCPGAWDEGTDLWNATIASEAVPVALGSTRHVVNTTVEIDKLEMAYALTFSPETDANAILSSTSGLIASHVGMPPDLILVDPDGSDASLVADGPLDVTISFLIVPPLAELRSVERSLMTLDDTSLSALLSNGKVAGISDRRRHLSISLVSVAELQVRPAQKTNTTKLMEVDQPCQTGYWCREGLIIACPRGTYNPEQHAMGPAACKPCPAFSTTTYEAATALEQCLCHALFYNADTTGVTCKRCPTGTQCTAVGNTITTLPVSVGYYRLDAHSTDVRRCPDAAVGCGVALQCRASTSGCRGGNSVSSQLPG